MSREMRVGIVGCGGIARAHADGYKSAGRAKIVMVYDPAHKAAKRLAAETGATAAGSLAEMIKDDHLDAVSICSPPAAHMDNCAPFLKAGIPVLCEKPIEVNAVRAARLAAVARRSGTIFMTAFCHRFHPSIIELKKLIGNGLLGRPLLFRNIFGGYSKLKGNHRTKPEISGGGCLVDHCAHSVDLFRFLVGEPAYAQAFAGNIMQKLRIEDFGMIHLATRGNKAFGEITASYSLKGCGNYVEWYGTKGLAIISYWNASHPDLTYKLEHDKEWTTVDCSRHPGRFAGEISHFLDCAAKRRQPSITADDGLKAARIAHAIYASVARGRRVAVRT